MNLDTLSIITKCRVYVMENNTSILVSVCDFWGVRLELDTSIQYNLISPCTVDFFKGNGIVYYSMSRKLITCKDGKKRKLRKVGLNFNIEGKAREIYSENGVDVVNNNYVSFYLDESICSYCTKDKTIGGILGADFIFYHKKVIDKYIENEVLVETVLIQDYHKGY